MSNVAGSYNGGREPHLEAGPSVDLAGETQVTTKRRRTILPLVATALVLILCGGLYVASVVLKRDYTYSDPSSGVSFVYPRDLTVSGSHQTLSDGTRLLNLDFSTGRTTPSGEPEKARMVVFPLFERPPGLPFDSVLRSHFGDRTGLLVIKQCEFGTTATQCLQIVDQQAWEQAGNGFINTNVFFGGPANVYGVNNGQVGTLDLSSAGGLEVLQSIRFER